MIWFMQIKYISIIPACVYVCKWNSLDAKVFYASTAPGYYLCQTLPIVDSIFIKLLRSEQNDRQFANGSFNLFSRIKTIEFKTTRHHVFPRVLMKKVSIGWVKGLVPNRRHAITWTNDNQDIWGHCSFMALMVSDILVNTDSSTGMTPWWCQAITSTSPILLLIKLIYSLTPEQKGRHFADGISNAFSWIKTCAIQ